MTMLGIGARWPRCRRCQGCRKLQSSQSNCSHSNIAQGERPIESRLPIWHSTYRMQLHDQPQALAAFHPTVRLPHVYINGKACNA